MSQYIISELQKQDYHYGFLQLLEQLTTVDANEIKYEQFSDQFDKITSKTFVIKSNNKIIGTASIFIESKFIHKLSSVGHIEDVVIDTEYRNKGLGKLLINHCTKYAREHQCYKIILNCDLKNVTFYEKCGFTSKNIEMSLYI